ncbi:MAG TPA: hypothetical protein VNZ47_17865 [Candidatus Dormibacteraeota bacterium]|jgi:hypothetical protein|nr:hypothetical protein [Candidatus Dormibacteraeota bacterium]
MKPALLLIAAAFTTSASPQTSGDALIGDWRGDSICVVRDSACRDEKALYHIKKVGSPSDRLTLRADKIVNGEPVNMGTIDCIYAAERKTLTCEFAKGVIHLTLRDTYLDGTMNLTDGTLWRNISLKRDGGKLLNR